MIRFVPYRFVPRESDTEPTTWKTGLSPEPTWTFWKRKISLDPAGNWTPGSSAPNVVTIPNMSLNWAVPMNSYGFSTWIMNLIHLILPIILLILNILWQGYTNLPKINELPQNSSRRKGNMKAVHNDDTWILGTTVQSLVVRDLRTPVYGLGSLSCYKSELISKLLIVSTIVRTLLPKIGPSLVF
jgi:hypothetical protein